MKIKIQTKIILWYTLIFIVLMLIFVLLIVSLSKSIVLNDAEAKIKHETEEIISDLSIDNLGNVVYSDDDEIENFRYVYDNVIFVIYHQDTLAHGSIPQAVTDLPFISYYTIQKFEIDTSETWLIYDVPIQSEYTLRAFYSTSESNSIMNQVFIWMIVVSPILILVSIFGGVLLIKKAFKPIHTISNTANDITKHQNYQLRIDYLDTKDEVANLAMTLNQMIHAMETSIIREQAFSSNVSHELRTPLAVLRAQTEYLENKTKALEVHSDVVDLLKQIAHMEKILSQLLDLVRSKHSQTLDIEQVSLSDLLDSIIQSMHWLAETKQIKFDFIKPNEPYLIETNVSYFIRIMDNLLSNAIKYNHPKGLIQVKVEVSKQFYEVIIHDTGMGMSQETLSKIFDPFFRADESRTVEEGLGIGLTITKSLVESLKGSIRYESTIGVGSTVYFNVPK